MLRICLISLLIGICVNHLNCQEGYLFGFNMSNLYCLDLTTGEYQLIGEIQYGIPISGCAYDNEREYYLHLGVEKVYKVNASNAETLQTYPFPVVDIGYDPQTQLVYGYNYSNLYTLNLTDGSINLLGELEGIKLLGGLAMDYENRRYLHLGWDTLYVVDMDDATVLDYYEFPVAEIEIDPVNGILYGYNYDTLYTINIENGLIDTIGKLEGVHAISGHAFDFIRGNYIQLYDERIYIINPQTAEIINDYYFPVVDIQFGIATFPDLLPGFSSGLDDIRINITPENKVLEIYINNDYTGNVKYYISDIKGRIILTDAFMKRRIELYEYVSIPGTYTGIYFITFDFSGKTISKEIVLTNN